MSEPVTRPDLPMPAGDYDLVRRASDLLSEAAADGLPAEVWELARHVYANWHIGDPGDGRLHAALLVAARLIRQDERERVARLAEAGEVTVYVDDDGSGIAVGVPFADLIRKSGTEGSAGNGQ